MILDEIMHRVDKLLVEMAVECGRQAKCDLKDHRFESAYAFAHQQAALEYAQVQVLTLFDKMRKEMQDG